VNRARVYLGTAAGLIGFSLFYTLPIYARLPRTFYDPVARRWFFAAGATPIPMGYVGQLIWAVAGALMAAGATMMVAGRKQDAGERACILGAAWALSALVIMVGYFTWNNWP
jgi:hypothetical protein